MTIETTSKKTSQEEKKEKKKSYTFFGDQHKTLAQVSPRL